MKITTKKLTLAALLIALSVLLSAFSIPVGATKCFPVQHFVNVIAGVTLGPLGAVLCAFVTSLLRFILGTGTLLAFPGSMIGALLAGLTYKYYSKIFLTSLAEVIGTGILGAIAAYPIAAFLMGADAAMFTYVIPFIISSTVGAIAAGFLILALSKTGILNKVITVNKKGELYE